MTNYPCATRWAVQIGYPPINLASASLLVGHTNKRYAQLGCTMQNWSTFMLQNYVMYKLGDVAMSNILKWEFLTNRNMWQVFAASLSYNH